MTEVVSAVAEAEGTDPTALKPPLADAIDPDALDAILRDSSNGVIVSFEYCGWEVDVRPGGVDLEDVGTER